jgi:hypothetical protein
MKKSLDALMEEITTDAYGDQEQLWAFRQAFEDNVAVPCEGSVLGQPVSVLLFDYDGNERRGLTAKCRGVDGRAHVVAAADVVLQPGSEGARYLAGYRKWIRLTRPAKTGRRSGPTPCRTETVPKVPIRPVWNRRMSEVHGGSPAPENVGLAGGLGKPQARKIVGRPAGGFFQNRIRA